MLTCLLSGLAGAEPPGGDAASCPHHSNEAGVRCTHHGADREDKWDEMRERFEKLQLRPTQEQELGQLFAIYQPRFREIARRGQGDREALLAAAPDDAAYNDLVARVSQDAAGSAGEVVVLLGELQATAYALLDEAQQARYRTLQAEAAAARAELKAQMAAKRAARQDAGRADSPFRAR